MTDQRVQLAEFVRPPVTRAVVSVAFDPIHDLRAAHIGAHWAGVNGNGGYPMVTEFEASAAPLETFGEALEDVDVDVTYGDAVPVPRVVIGSPDRGRQIAFQRDQFEISWMKTDDDADYPRFDALLTHFREQWSSWNESLRRFSLELPVPKQAGFTYYNSVSHGAGWTTLEDLSALFRLPTQRQRQGMLEVFHYTEHEVVIADDGTRRRLHIRLLVDPAEGEDAAASLVINCGGELSKGEHAETLISSISQAHDYAVAAFLSATTEQAHAYWGRISK